MKAYNQISRTMRGALVLALAATMLLVSSACKRDEAQDPGAPSGPSGHDYFINIYASPSVLPSNTTATSNITAILRRYDGLPMSGRSVRFEVVAAGTSSQTAIGTLSSKNGVTDGGGVARTVYTVPKFDVEGFVYVRATWTDSPWTENYQSRIPISLRYKGDPPTTNDYPVATFTIVTPEPYNVNQEITFDGKDSTDPDGVIVKFIWDFGDSRTVVNFDTLDNERPELNQPIVTHRYRKEGGYVITLKVVDDGGLYDVEQQVIKIGVLSGLEPTASFVIVTKTDSGAYDPDTEIEFDGSTSSDPDGAIRRWDWDWGDTKFSYNAGPHVKHKWHKLGSYPVSLTVTDDDGLKGVTSQNIRIGTGGGFGAPTASFTALPNPADIDEQIVFDASGSSDSDGAIVGYHWFFGNGRESSQGPIVYFSYGEPGIYNVILVVTDDDGLEGTAVVSVNVDSTGGNGSAPTACFEITPDISDIPVGQILKFDGTCSTDSDGEIRRWRWDYGDDVIDDGSNSVVTHAYSSADTFTVFLTVTDDDGLTGVTSEVITVGLAPVADAGNSQTFNTAALCLGGVSHSFDFDGSNSVDNDGSIVSYLWDFGDGSTSGVSASPLASHNYGPVTADTSFTVTLTVTDDDGLRDTDSTTVTINCT